MTSKNPAQLKAIRRLRKTKLGSSDVFGGALGLGAVEAEILSAIATPALDFADIAGRLLQYARSRTRSISTGLFRSVQDIGLLVPLGSISIDENENQNRLTTAMARAADQLISQLRSSPGATIYSSHPANYSRRTSIAGGYIVWATAIINRAVTESSLSGATDNFDNDFIDPGTVPQIHGVLVVVSKALSGKKIPPRQPSKAHHSDPKPTLAIRRVVPFFQLLLQQLVLREAASSARRQTGKRLREVGTIYEIGRAINRMGIEELFQFITQQAADVMDAQACSLLLINENTDQLYIAASSGLPDAVVENTRILVGEGIAGRVAQTGEALLVQSDARLDPRFRGSRGIGLPGISSSITMPMVDDNGEVKGVLCIRRRTPSAPFTEDDKRLFSIFSTQAALAIKNARLYRQLRSRVQELSTLSSLTETISSTLDLDFVLNEVADSLVQLVGFDRCLLYLKDDSYEGSEQFTVRVSRGFEGVKTQSAATDKLIYEIASRLIPILMEEGDNSLPIAMEFAKVMGMRSFFAQPMIVRGVAIGVLVVTNDQTRRPIAYSNLDLLATFLQHAGIAIENARLYAQMERQVNELHTLYNMGRSLTTTYGLTRACSTVASVAKTMVAGDGVLLILFNDRLDTLRIREVQGMPDEISDLLRLLPDSADISPIARALREPVQVGSDSVISFETLFGGKWGMAIMAINSRFPSLLLVPLVTEDTVVGFLLLCRSQITVFRPEETRLVGIIASQAGALLRGAALYEQSIEQRVLELSALYELSKKVRSAKTLNGALDAIMDIVSSVIWCDAAEIFTVDKQNGLIIRQTERGEVMPASPIGFNEKRIPAWILRERKALLIADISSDPRFIDYVPDPALCKSLMAIPVFLGDEVLAVLQVQASVSGLYNEDNVKMLSLIAAQAAALFRDMESLRELTTYTDNILRSIAAGVVTLDSQGHIVTMNVAAERLLRVKLQSVADAPFDDLLELLHGEPSDIEDVRKMVSMAVETGQIVQRHRLRLFWDSDQLSGGRAVPKSTQFGEPVIVNGSASQLLSERQEYLGVVLVFEDITKEDEMEQELSRIGRLAEIGQLAAGIAHELRNPLASIKGAAQVLRGDLSPEMIERHGEFLDIIVREVDDLNATTSEFLEFSRPTTPMIETFSLNQLLQRRIGFMRTEIAQFGVEINENYDEELPNIQADDKQLERVFLNIVLNGLQAMPEGGTLSISTRYLRPSLPDNGAGQTSLRDSYVEVKIGDTGMGIPESRREKIFAPFFTTKTRGTGLGLPIVQKIIDSHGGQIRVESEIGIGTVFVILLPVYSPFTQRLQLQEIVSAEIADERLDSAFLYPARAWLTKGIGAD